MVAGRATPTAAVAVQCSSRSIGTVVQKVAGIGGVVMAVAAARGVVVDQLIKQLWYR